MARNTAYRKYQITINNPEKHGYSHSVLKRTLNEFSGCLYWCMCDEIGEQGTLHTHLYAAFKNGVEFTTMQRRFFGAHIEGAKGSHAENRDYIRKEGKWLDDAKHETNLTETFEESGELPAESKKAESQSEAILAMLEAGADNEEIIRQFPTWMKHIKSLDAMRQTIVEKQQSKVYRHLDASYIWGKTGAGKTRSIMEKYGYEKVFRVTNYAHPFDGYKGQDVILFDEFRSDLPIKDMLKYLEGYPLMLPCRYQDRAACYTKVYVVSNIPFHQQYPNIQVNEPETWAAFCRRFNVGIFEFGEDLSNLPF